MNQRFCNGIIHVIKPGDNLYQLSRRYRVPLALILRANPYVDVYNLRPGQEICIPMSRPPRPMPGPMPGPTPGATPGPMPGPMPAPAPAPGPEPRDDRMERSYDEDDRQDDRDDFEPENREYSMEMEENREERELYRADGTKSLGRLLEETGLSLTEFFERNNPDQLIIASDVMLDVPKKV